MIKTKTHPVRAMVDPKLTVLVDSVPGAVAVRTALADPESRAGIRVLSHCDADVAEAERLIVFSSASNLERVASCVSAANKAHRLTALLVEMDVAENWLPYVYSRAGLRTLRNTVVHWGSELPKRILSAWAMGAQEDFIADAAVIHDSLIVRTCAFEELSVAFDAFPALRQIPASDRNDFEVEEEGLLLHWPQYDVHLGVEDIRFANDPKRQRAARAAAIGDQRALGAALRELREEANLRQSDIVGISERQVRRVESGDPLTTETLDAFARAIRVDADVLLDRLSELMLSFERSRSNEPTDHRKALTVVSGPSSTTHAVPAGLKLAADSSAEISTRLELRLGQAVIHGRLDHDFRGDELFFLIERVSGVNGSTPKGVIVATVKHATDPLVSAPFIPISGSRISLAAGRGIVPSDVTALEVRPANEQ